MADTKDLQVRGKQEVVSPGEHTETGLVFTPRTDIFENEKEIVLLADMPGVKADDLNIDLRENVLTLTGDVAPFEKQGEQSIFMEYGVGKYQRQFSLSEIIDQQAIEARLNNGVLRLTLPKVEKAQPRKITVSAG